MKPSTLPSSCGHAGRIDLRRHGRSLGRDHRSAAGPARSESAGCLRAASAASAQRPTTWARSSIPLRGRGARRPDGRGQIYSVAARRCGATPVPTGSGRERALVTYRLHALIAACGSWSRVICASTSSPGRPGARAGRGGALRHRADGSPDSAAASTPPGSRWPASASTWSCPRRSAVTRWPGCSTTCWPPTGSTRSRFRVADAATSYTIVVSTPGPRPDLLAPHRGQRLVRRSRPRPGRDRSAARRLPQSAGGPVRRRRSRPGRPVRAGPGRAARTTSLDLAVVDVTDPDRVDRWQWLADRAFGLTDVITPSIDDLNSCFDWGLSRRPGRTGRSGPSADRPRCRRSP